MSNVNNLIASLQALVAQDPSVGLLPYYTNSPMDGEFAFAGNHHGIYVGEVQEEEGGQVYMDTDSLPEDIGEVTPIRAVIIDSH